MCKTFENLIINNQIKVNPIFLLKDLLHMYQIKFIIKIKTTMDSHFNQKNLKYIPIFLS